MKQNTFAWLNILDKRVNQDQEINKRQQSNKAGNNGTHIFDSFEDIKDQVIAQNGEVHIVEVDFQIQQRICCMIDGKSNVDFFIKDVHVNVRSINI